MKQEIEVEALVKFQFVAWDDASGEGLVYTENNASEVQNHVFNVVSNNLDRFLEKSSETT